MSHSILYLLAIICVLSLRIIIASPLSIVPSASPTTIPTSIFSATCPVGWTASADRCYLLESGDRTWADCKSYCATKGGYLPCIKSAYQSNFIHSLQPTLASFSWIGFNDVASEGNFVWDNGCTNSYTQWDANRPDNSGGIENCGSISTSTGNWDDVPCGANEGCTCESQFVSTANSCPVGWTLSDDGVTCYHFANAGVSKPTFTECESNCTAMGASMLCIESAAQIAFVWKMRGGRQTWTGLRKVPATVAGVFTWPAGCTSTYTNWNSGEPNPAGNEYYVAMYFSFAGKWADGGMQFDANCACQKPATLRTVAPSAAPTCAPSAIPTAPTVLPTIPPTLVPSCAPTVAPVADPTASPTTLSTVHPSPVPTTAPSAIPSAVPTVNPSALPSFQPSANPTTKPSQVPSALPSCLPTTKPTTSPTPGPSAAPTEVPTVSPTVTPTADPTTVLTVLPSIMSTASPTLDPSALPTVHPTASPTTTPSARPTTQSPISQSLTVMMSSPTYRVGNGFAFVLVGSDGSVRTWGEAARGGESSAVQAELAGNVSHVVASRSAFVAMKVDGSVVPWGARSAIHSQKHLDGPLISLVANEGAFAGIVADTGAVYAFGAQQNGGNVIDDTKCNGFSAQLSANVLSITASAASFAALKADGTVYTWGSRHCAGGVSSLTVPSLAGIIEVVATREAFAAILSTGKVMSWGSKNAGGDSSAVASQLTSNVLHVVAGRDVFAAFKSDTSLVVWGYGAYGGDSISVATQLTAEVAFVAHTSTALAALKAGGTVVAWGKDDGGGDASAVQAQLVNVAKIYGANKAFAALTASGKVVVWGKAAYGGAIPSHKVSALSSGVISIYHTDRAFAALKTGGAVVVWGQAGHGGSPGAAVEVHLMSGVHTVCSNDVAFSVIKTDGSVVGWGHPVSIPAAGVLFNSSAFQGNVTCAW